MAEVEDVRTLKPKRRAKALARIEHDLIEATCEPLPDHVMQNIAKLRELFGPNENREAPSDQAVAAKLR